jgi:O-acetyl-ADP-ribose deacetylase (regulator of RNase III)
MSDCSGGQEGHHGREVGGGVDGAVHRKQGAAMRAGDGQLEG